MQYLCNIENATIEPSRDPAWYSKALFGGSFLSRGLVKIVPNLKKDMKLSLLDWNGSSLLQTDAGDCAWNPTQMLVINERVISPKTYKINSEQCIHAFESTFIVDQFRAGANDEQISNSFQSAILDILATEVNKEVETRIWGGSASIAGQFDGWLKIAETDTDTIKIEGQTLTVDNVIPAVESVFQQIPTDLYNVKPVNEIKLYVSYGTFRNLLVALTHEQNLVYQSAFTVVRGDATKEQTIYYLGLEIIPVLGITNSQMLATHTSNQVFGTDLESDLSRIEIGQFEKPKDDMLWIKGRLRLQTEFIYPQEVVIFSPNV